MFNRLSAVSLYVVFALALLAAATPAQPAKRWDVTTTVTVTPPAPTQTSVSQCNTGSIHCCENTYESSSPLASLVSSLVGLDLSGVTGVIGTQCSSLSVVGGGTQWYAS